MYFKTLLLAAIGAFAMLCSTKASAQFTVDLQNHSPCGHEVEVWITDGSSTTLLNTYYVDCCGSHVYPTIPATYNVAYYKVFDANGGSTHAVVHTGNPTDVAGDCFSGSGTDDVSLINATNNDVGVQIL